MKSIGRKTYPAALVLAALFPFGLTNLPARAADPPPAPAAPDWSKGILQGQVMDIVSGKPIDGATVALQDDKGKILAWSKTNAQGRYALATDALQALRLRPSPRKGLLAQIGGGVVKVVTAPVKVAGTVVDATAKAVKAIDPVGTAKATAVSVIAGSPAPLAANVAGTVQKAVAGKAAQAPQQAKEDVLNQALGERQAAPKAKRDALVPGEVWLSVSAPNYQDVKGKAGAYWLDPPAKTGDGKPRGAGAWLETARLAPAGSDKKSDITDMAVLLSDPRLEPGLAPAGATVTVRATLKAPADNAKAFRVFAREDRQKQVIELKPQPDGVFVGVLTLDPKMPLGLTRITIAALRTEPVEVSLKDSKADPLLDFAQKLDDLDPDQKYDFDPRIMASENRLELKLTVLDPKQATPPTAPPPAAAPAANPPAPAAPPK